jgi:hypothetical protein
VQHIHLLSERAFKNLAPHHLVIEALAKQPSEYRFVGCDTAQLNVNNFEHVFGKAIKRYNVD